MKDKKILLGHGGGGSLSRELIKELLLKNLDNPILRELSDSAVVDYREKIAFTTDSFVVSPLEFSGGDIGKLAVCGTVNDLVMQGAVPEYLSLALIIEEGLSYRVLEKIVGSIASCARACGVRVVTGDLKVVERGACDKIFINTSGIGRVLKNRRLSLKNIRAGDKIILTGSIGRHGLAVLAGRKELGAGFNIASDCAALNGLLIPVLKKTGAIRFMRDPTRGGLACVLNEMAEGTRLGMIIDEKNIPVPQKVRAACELLGIDPLTLANEGRAVMAVSPEGVGKVLSLLRVHPLARQARVIGRVVLKPAGRLILNTVVGTQRIVDMPAGELLPRIC